MGWFKKKESKENIINVYKETFIRKKITELTIKEAEEIVKSTGVKDFIIDELSFEPKIDEEGHQQITFSGESIIGICYRAGSNYDGYLLPFNELKVIKWLFNNGYDINDLLDEANERYQSLNEEFKEIWDTYCKEDLDKLIKKQIDERKTISGTD